MDELLQETLLLDYKSKNIPRQIDDNIPASQVLSDGIGQCNAKGRVVLINIFEL